MTLQQAGAASHAASRRGGGGRSDVMAARAEVASVDPSRGPAPPRPQLLAVVAEEEWAVSVPWGCRR